MITLPTICEPCPEVVEPVLTDKLPDSMCPCPDIPEDNHDAILPTKTIISVTTNCFMDMLHGMTSVKYCTIGPTC